jgi:hypothetical protein
MGEHHPRAATTGFEPASVDRLPAPARRWLLHAIAQGAPLLTRVTLTMHGEIRLGRWRSFRATEVLSLADGFTWSARVGLIRGHDRFLDGRGEMAWKLLGLVPVQSGRGPDIDRSASGRLAGEAVFTPAALLDVGWRAIDDHRAVAEVPAGGRNNLVTFDVADDGRLRSQTTLRWGDPDGTFRERPMGPVVEEERCFGGYTIPSTFRAGWWASPDELGDGEFFRCTIDRATFR